MIESRIKKGFKKLHQLLDDEEKAMIKELQEEKEEKLEIIRDNVKMMNQDIASLSEAIKDLEQTLNSGDIRLFKVSMFSALSYTSFSLHFPNTQLQILQ